MFAHDPNRRRRISQKRSLKELGLDFSPGKSPDSEKKRMTKTEFRNENEYQKSIIIKRYFDGRI